METNCKGKEAEIIQLVAETEKGKTFSRLILPEKEISHHASRVNKFQTTSSHSSLQRKPFCNVYMFTGSAVTGYLEFVLVTKDLGKSPFHHQGMYVFRILC